ncbi:eukaryotic translation elongation factor 1 epsilon-1 [Parambassis ranga]|uniref:Eukaryotic translation elongation factor 1 epsilon-1 n=1 Tax=Parambassis ranga TaxID=210632 RepID=A0A6P7KN98_9TELE|nr:eukaryotic translation elongation factor 1 epsilon-1 [Parambassis ranga]
MAVRELSSLEKYLGLKKPNKYSTQGDKKNNNGPPLAGLATIAHQLVKEAERPELLGDTAESRAVVHQWLEYSVTKLDSYTKEDIKIILKDLSLYLLDKVYLAGNQFTVADTLMYYGIHPVMVDLTIQEKERYVTVTRWFDHIQHHPGVRQRLPPVLIHRNRIYMADTIEI